MGEAVFDEKPPNFPDFGRFWPILSRFCRKKTSYLALFTRVPQRTRGIPRILAGRPKIPWEKLFLRKNPKISRILADFGQFCPILPKKDPVFTFVHEGTPANTWDFGAFLGRPEKPTPANTFDGVPPLDTWDFGAFLDRSEKPTPANTFTGVPPSGEWDSQKAPQPKRRI